MSGCPFANLLDPDSYVDGMPYNELEKIRRQGDVVRREEPITGVPYWIVAGREQLDFVSKNPALFSSHERTAFPMEFPQETIEMQRMTIINMDPPEHQKYRKLTRAAFTPKAVEAYEPIFKDHAKRIVDAVAALGKCEFVEEVAAELPLLAILELLEVPAKDRKLFFDWTNTMIFADDPDMAETEEDAMMAAAMVVDYAMKVAAKHRTNPRNDGKKSVLAALLDGEVDGKPMDDLQFGQMFILILVGGNESTRTVISHGMRLLMENPDQLQYLQENPDQIPAACEEMLRYNTAFIAMRRTAMQDIELGGQQIKQGDKVLLHYHTVNHSEDVFGEDAMIFDVTRQQRMPDLYNQHRSFGIGQHFCLGSHLARLELRLMMQEIIPRMVNPAFDDEPQFVRSIFVNAIKEMNITFTPEAT